jgi:hypothetical protein
MMRSPYRWWKVFAWRDELGTGVKLGPLTITTYEGLFSDRGREWAVIVLNRWPLVDTGLRALRQRYGHLNRS